MLVARVGKSAKDEAAGAVAALLWGKWVGVAGVLGLWHDHGEQLSGSGVGFPGGARADR